IADWLHLRASTGRGFKTPTFDQVYLKYTNPTVGVSAFGTAVIKEGIEQLQQAGKIDKMLRDVSNIAAIEAEHSWAFNTGFDLIFNPALRFKVNFFYNRI